MTDSIIYTEIAGYCQHLPGVLIQCVQLYVGRDVSLAGLDLSGENWQDADFSGTTLSHSDFSNSNLAGSNFTNSILKNVSFLNSNLSGSIMRAADLHNAAFACHESPSPQCMFGVSFYGAKLIGAQFPGLTMVDVDCRYANLSGADFTEANLHIVNMSSASMIDTVLGGAALYRVTLTDADMECTDFRCASLEMCNLEGATIYGIKPHSSTVRLAHDSVVTLAHHLQNLRSQLLIRV
jgi:uncharacterized protein YjbI with pentapeptide repeats